MSAMVVVIGEHIDRGLPWLALERFAYQEMKSSAPCRIEIGDDDIADEVVGEFVRSVVGLQQPGARGGFKGCERLLLARAQQRERGREHAHERAPASNCGDAHQLATSLRQHRDPLTHRLSYVPRN